MSFLPRFVVLFALSACAVDPELTAGNDAGPDVAADAPLAADGTATDATADSKMDAVNDVASDQSSPKDTGLPDGACTTTCPTNTTCNGATCVVAQGPGCSSAVAASSTTGAFSGTTCQNAGSSITTTCPNAITAGATFITFPNGGGPFTGTFKAINGPIQVVVMSSCGATPACYSIASGGSQAISIPDNGATVAVVSASTCSDFSVTYLPS